MPESDLKDVFAKLNSLSESIANIETKITDKILSEVDRKNSGLASSLSKDFKKVSEAQQEFLEQFKQNSTQPPENPETITPPTTDPNPDILENRTQLKALNKKLQELELENQRKDKALAERTRDTQLMSLMSGKKSPFPDRATKAFLIEHSNQLVSENGNWYVQKSEDEVESLDSAVDSFLVTDFGSTFLPPHKVRGMGLRSSNYTPKAPKKELSLNEMIIEEDNY